MPEGDSVYRLARRLEASLDGGTLTRSELRRADLVDVDLGGQRLVEHDTHGKHLFTRFSGGGTLHTHLKMTGSWAVVRAGRRLPRALDDEVRVLLAFEDGPTAYGLNLPVVEFLRTADETQVTDRLGPDPLRADWDPAEAARRLGSDPARPLAPALLDQYNVAGFGNLWANELCFLRGHSPWTPVGEVDLAALLRLGARALLISATRPGAYQVTTGNTRRGEQHWVAGRAHRPCLRCAIPIRVRAETPTTRRTWWCPHCQPGPGA